MIPAGRIFLRRLLDLAHSIPDLDTALLLTQDIILDINWWLLFARSWNGQSFFLDLTWSHSPEMNLYTTHYLKLGSVPTGKAIGSTKHGLPPISTILSSGKSSMPSSWHVRYGGTCGGCREFSFTATINLWRNGLSQSPMLMDQVRALFFCRISSQLLYHNFSHCWH